MITLNNDCGDVWGSHESSLMDMFVNPVPDMLLEKEFAMEQVLEEKECFKDVWNINIDLPPQESLISFNPSSLYNERIATEENYSYKENSASLDDIWESYSNTHHLPAFLVEGKECNNDMNKLNKALNDTEVKNFQESLVLMPELTQYSHFNGQITESKKEIEIFSKPKAENQLGRKVMKPRENSESQKSLKYRRMRDLNNEASKKCRKKRKEKLLAKEDECREEEEKNKRLREKLQTLQDKVTYLKSRCRLKIN